MAAFTNFVVDDTTGEEIDAKAKEDLAKVTLNVVV